MVQFLVKLYWWLLTLQLEMIIQIRFPAADTFTVDNLKDFVKFYGKWIGT